MPYTISVLDPQGGLDQDSDLAKVKNGDYVDALNIQHITDGGATTFAIQNTKGNIFRFGIPATTAHNKIYELLIQISAGAVARQVTIYNTAGVSIGVVNWNDDTTTVATSYSNFTTALATTIGLTSPLQTYTVSLNGNYAVVTITTVTGMEYSIKNTQSTNPTPVYIIQEAIDKSIEGDANIIGSYDLLGQLYVWSTSQESLPSTLTDTDGNAITLTASNVVGTKIRITTSGPTSLIPGESIVISGCTGAGAASTNGTWIINVIDSTHFDLQNSVWVSNTISATSTPIITINSEGIGEVGVAVYDPNTDTTAYTRLIKSKELNFRTPKQCDTYCEQNNFETSIYWTDDYNIPRVLYYSGVFITDGAITIINPAGEYAYGSIADETKLILSNALVGFSFTSQVQAGGGIVSGNWRYSIRLLTATFSATNWSEISNPVNVYVANDAGNRNQICGDAANTQTAKINTFTLTNLPVGAFAYVELAAIHYVDGAITGSIVSRTPIGSATMTIQHTGLELNAVNLDVSTLNQFSFDIETAKNIDAIDNRLILSNLTTAQEIDFTSWTETWQHSLKYKLITPLGNATDNAIGAAEYQDPINVYSNVGYMLNDTYRIGARFRLKASGNFTKVFWIDDIIINTSATNITSPNRRVAGLPVMELSEAGHTKVPYIEVDNIDLTFLIDGTPARDLIESIHFERVERVKEVLCTGNILMTVTGTSDDNTRNLNYGTSNYGEWPLLSGDPSNLFVGPIRYSGADLHSFTAVKTIAKLYSPDIFFGKTAPPSFLSGDQFICFGNGGFSDVQAVPRGGYLYQSFYTEWDAFFNGGTPQVVSLTGALFLNDGGSGTVSGTPYSCAMISSPPAAAAGWEERGGLIITSGSIFPAGSRTDYGFYYGQYFRALGYTDPDDCKYGTRNLSIYIPTGAILTIDASTSSISTQAVLGGDVVTQKTYIKHRAADGTFGVKGFGGGFSFVSQNVVNSQMSVKYNNTSGAWLFPRNTADNWLNENLGDLGTQIAPYDKGYTIANGISNDTAFDASLPQQNDLPTEIRWSDLKPQNAVVDNFRIFLPLNFKDLPLSWGEITHHTNFNGELFTFQPRMVQRQYFNTRGTMQVGGQTPTDVLIGDGSVMSRDGQMVTGIGTYHKWSVIKGKSAQGNDTLYWINTELKKFMRMGFDGTISIADIHGMQSFAANNLTWVIGKDNPASGQGICGVWDDRYVGAIWTVRGKREFATWKAGSTYAKGDIVSGGYRFDTPLVYEATGEIYISLEDGNINHDPTTGTTHWFIVPHTGTFTVNGILRKATEFYNEYTIEFNEQKNKFTTFYSFKPKIYLKWTDTFLTPKPISNTGLVAQHRLGPYCVWYGFTTSVITDASNASPIVITMNTNGFNTGNQVLVTDVTGNTAANGQFTITVINPTSLSLDGSTGNGAYTGNGNIVNIAQSPTPFAQIENGSIELLFNKDESLIKHFFAILVNSEIVPVRVDFTTRKQQTFAVAANFEKMIDFWTSSIKNDILTSSNGQNNNEDTSRLFGQWIKIKITFEAGQFQKLVDVVTKFTAVSRTYTK